MLFEYGLHFLCERNHPHARRAVNVLKRWQVAAAAAVVPMLLAFHENKVGRESREHHHEPEMLFAEGGILTDRAGAVVLRSAWTPIRYLAMAIEGYVARREMSHEVPQ
jgi:hypothetical protein